MVLRGALSAFSRKSRLPLSSTMQMVTSTCWRCASASAAATMVLTAARFRYFLLGKSAADAIRTRQRRAAVIVTCFDMGRDGSTWWRGFPDARAEFSSTLGSRSVVPTLRKEREGWGHPSLEYLQPRSATHPTSLRAGFLAQYARNGAPS